MRLNGTDRKCERVSEDRTKAVRPVSLAHTGTSIPMDRTRFLTRS